MRHLVIVAVTSAIMILPVGVSAVQFDYDLGVGNRDITFSKGTLVAGDNVRVYARVTNHGTEDIQGYVTFYRSDALIADSQVVTVRPNASYDDVWVDFKVPSEAFNIRAQIKGTNPQDQNPANDVALSPMFNPEPDVDGDGISDGRDNCKTVANASQSDRDGDRIGDACDTYPDDATNTPPKPAPTPVSVPVPKPAPVAVTTPTPATVTVTKPVVKTEAPKPATPAVLGERGAAVVAATSSVTVASATSTTSSTPETVPAIDASEFANGMLPAASIKVKRLTWNSFEFMTPPDQAGSSRMVIWRFGDGATGTGELVSHRYRKTGDFEIVAEMTGAKGDIIESKTSISISFWNFGNWLLWLLMAAIVAAAITLAVVALRGGKRRE